MNLKNCLFVLISFFVLSNIYSHPGIRELTAEQRQYLLDKSKPTDPKKTPTSPDVIEHTTGIKNLGGRNFYWKRIYFGNLPSGEPHYNRIWRHCENPDFDNTIVVIRKKVSLLLSIFSYIPFLNINTDDYFEVIGAFGDQSARNQLINSISQGGGIWCPRRNPQEEDFFIGGTREKGMCDEFRNFKENFTAQQKNFKK